MRKFQVIALFFIASCASSMKNNAPLLGRYARNNEEITLYKDAFSYEFRVGWRLVAAEGRWWKGEGNAIILNSIYDTKYLPLGVTNLLSEKTGRCVYINASDKFPQSLDSLVSFEIKLNNTVYKAVNRKLAIPDSVKK